jgi:hypothetical protein
MADRVWMLTRWGPSTSLALNCLAKTKISLSAERIALSGIEIALSGARDQKNAHAGALRSEKIAKKERAGYVKLANLRLANFTSLIRAFGAQRYLPCGATAATAAAIRAE